MDETTPTTQQTRASIEAAASPKAASAEPVSRPPKQSGTTAEATPEFDLDSPDLYLNRELTWLSFNRRVLHEGEDRRTPLLERLKFLAIVSGNLDEFFMKRIAGLKHLLAAGLQAPTVDGRKPAQQIAECHAVIRDIQRHQQLIFEHLLGELAEHGIHLVDYTALNG